MTIYVDADACPVKQEALKVAKRYALELVFISNSEMFIPEMGDAKLVVVPGDFDAADDWIVEHVNPNDIVVTADIPLVHRCIKKGAQVLSPSGRLFSEQNIGNILATRDLLHVLRGSGENTGGPAPFQKEDRSRFLRVLDQVIQDVRRKTI